jgi:hypothetical protein
MTAAMAIAAAAAAITIIHIVNDRFPTGTPPTLEPEDASLAAVLLEYEVEALLLLLLSPPPFFFCTHLSWGGPMGGHPCTKSAVGCRKMFHRAKYVCEKETKQAQQKKTPPCILSTHART